MSLSVTAIRIIAFIVALTGLALFLTAIGIETGAHIPVVWWLEGLVGIGCIGIGAYLVRGGNITP